MTEKIEGSDSYKSDRVFDRYPEYKNSGAEWLGDVPTHWNLRRMAYVAKSTGGGTPSKEHPEYWRGDIPWVSPKDMKRRVISDSIDHVSEVAIAETGLSMIDDPAVLIVVRGMILAHSFPAAYTAAPVTINQDMKALRLANGINANFFVYLLAGMERFVLSLIEAAGHGTKKLRSDLWRSVELWLPDHQEQLKIAEFLDRETGKIDGLVGKKEELIKLLQEKRVALITHAVTKGLDPNAPMKDSGIEWLGEIPAHWRVVRLGHLASVGNGSTPSRETHEYWSGGTHPWLTSGKIHEAVIEAADEYVTDLAMRECHLPMARAESVLVAITGEGRTRGRAALLRIDSAVSQHLAFLTPDRNEMDSAFLWRFLESKYQWLRIESSGGGSTRAALTCEFLKSVRILVPPLNEQVGIARLVQARDDQIALLVNKIRTGISHLQELRTSLISAAVTGKIDVREASP